MPTPCREGLNNRYVTNRLVQSILSDVLSVNRRAVVARPTCVPMLHLENRLPSQVLGMICHQYLDHQKRIVQRDPNVDLGKNTGHGRNEPVGTIDQVGRHV